LSRTCESELMSSDWQCEEVDASSETKEDEECMLTEFDCCNSKNQSSSVAGADTSLKQEGLWQQEWEQKKSQQHDC
jgi:hypothetical protein